MGAMMLVTVSEAKAQLMDLVKQSEAGDEIIITRHGQAAVRLVPVKSVSDFKARKKLLEEARRSGPLNAKPGPCAARSQDFLYDAKGLPK